MRDSRRRLRRTAAGAGFTELVLESFRFHGRLLAEGDRLGADLGLTSARWQVLGAIDEAALPVAQIARNMGLTRQAVQRVANDLADAGLVRFAENPDHRRAKLVVLTDTGRSALDEIGRRQVAWSNEAAASERSEDLEAAAHLLRRLRERIESGVPDESVTSQPEAPRS